MTADDNRKAFAEALRKLAADIESGVYDEWSFEMKRDIRERDLPSEARVHHVPTGWREWRIRLRHKTEWEQSQDAKNDEGFFESLRAMTTEREGIEE